MKKRTLRWGILLVVLITLIVLAIAGGWYFLRSSFQTADGPPPSPVLVFVTSPPSGDEVHAGDYMQVTVQAVAPSPIANTELFVDGMSLGLDVNSPGNAAWTWQAWPPGVHTFYARSFTLDGQIGQSQTVIVNVLAGDGTMQVFAEEAQTLEQVGADFGVPPDQMASANPNVDPSQPLSGGQPVNIPAGGGNAGGAGAGGGSGNGGGVNIPPGDLQPILVTWQFKPTQAVDKSYCYASGGNGVWEKIPKEPFEFFTGEGNFYTQVSFDFATQYGLIQAQCWGWLGGTLKYLGQGQTSFDAQKPPDQLTVVGDGFVLAGAPEIPADAGGGAPIMPPFGLREPKDSADCTAHGHPLIAPFICDTLMNQNPKQYLILEWEWTPETCWPGNCQYDSSTEVEGYHIYEVDPVTQTTIYLKQVQGVNNKATAIPLSWGPKCYGVDAYTASGIQTSEIAVYCPGQPPASKEIILTPTDWLTAKGMDFESGDCDDYGKADTYLLKNQTDGFGNQPGQVLVGDFILDTDCFKSVNYSAAVKFLPEKSLPPNAVVQSAVLTFSKIFMDYGATGLAGGKPTSCAASIGKATKSWTHLADGNHFADNASLYAYNSPITSLNPFMALKADVTTVVSQWVKHPESNHGFILLPVVAPPPEGDGSGECTSGLGNFQLTIHYFAP